MNKIIWHSGPPPHVGWWCASVGGCIDVWRWWDGNKWSHPACSHYGPLTAAFYASIPTANSRSIQWCDYWPENARVPRIDPRAGQ